MNILLILIVIIISLIGIVIAFLPRKFWDSLWDNFSNFPVVPAMISLAANAGLSWCLHGILNNQISSVLPAIIAPIAALVIVFGNELWLGIVFGFLGAEILHLGAAVTVIEDDEKFWPFCVFSLCVFIAINFGKKLSNNMDYNFNGLQRYLVVTGISWIGLMLGLLFFVAFKDAKI